jgi:hypothetical protein
MTPGKTVEYHRFTQAGAGVRTNLFSDFEVLILSVSSTVIASHRLGAKRRPVSEAMPRTPHDRLLRRIRLRPKAGFGGQQRSSQ